MKPRIYDITIVGAGPAGMSAAAEAAALGLSVVILDEQSGPGGQVYNSLENSPLQPGAKNGAHFEKGVLLADALGKSGVEYVRGAAVWLIEQAGDVWQVAYSCGKTSARVESSSLVLATGSYERPFPIPGWDLPNVMTAGAAQLLLKSSGIAKSGAIFAGSGPLLYLSALQYMRLGVPVRALLDTAGFDDYRRSLRYLAGALPKLRTLLDGARMLWEIRNSACSYIPGVSGLRAEGADKLEAVVFEAGGKSFRMEGAEALFLHHGVIPNVQLALSAGCAHYWDEDTLAWCIACDQYGRTSQKGLLVAGDAAGILGAEAAPLRAKLSVRAIAEDLGKLGKNHLVPGNRTLARALCKEHGVRRFLDKLYRPPSWVRSPDDGTLVCRCEEVTAGAIRTCARSDHGDPNQLKSLLRCGMGPCQGRMCATVISEIVAAAKSASPAAVGRFRPRPPIKPVSLEDLATLRSEDEAIVDA